METIEKKYEKAFEQLASIQPIFPEQAKRQMAEMVEIIAKSNEHIQYRLNTNQDFSRKGGFIIEEATAETYNLDAALNNDRSRAITDRYKVEWKNQGLRGNDNPDLVIVKDGQTVFKAQSKFDKTPKTTAGQFSQINADKNVKYGEMDAYLAPSDQVEAIKTYSNDKSIQKGQIGDKALEESFRQTSKKVTGKIEKNGNSSTEFTKSDANEFGKGNLERLKQKESEYQTKSTLKQMGNAAIGAAAMSAVVSGSINTIKYVQLARDGKITAEEATIKIIGETVLEVKSCDKIPDEPRDAHVLQAQGQVALLRHYWNKPVFSLRNANGAVTHENLTFPQICKNCFDIEFSNRPGSISVESWLLYISMKDAKAFGPYTHSVEGLENIFNLAAAFQQDLKTVKNDPAYLNGLEYRQGFYPLCSYCEANLDCPKFRQGDYQPQWEPAIRKLDELKKRQESIKSEITEIEKALKQAHSLADTKDWIDTGEHRFRMSMVSGRKSLNQDVLKKEISDILHGMGNEIDVENLFASCMKQNAPFPRLTISAVN